MDDIEKKDKNDNNDVTKVRDIIDLLIKTKFDLFILIEIVT